MDINPGQEHPTLDKVIVEPQKKKNKMFPKFNSPKNENNTWKRTKKILFKG